ncbi:Ger(x)C family spore germination protein [Ectobacillus funiculus]|uniref:Ger(X)C family spore germination protein n=1 Tax=Ectobacillus funiculus TaxID=137993 RepID=A0ABV5WCS6_9BACI
MKKILTLLIVIIPVLTGCWSRHEVNDVAIVLGVALDKAKNGNLLLSLQIAVPKASGGANGSAQGSDHTKSTMMVSAKGPSILEAYRIIQEKISREIFFAHDRVIIVGEELARDGVSPILDFFSRHRHAHLRNYLLFTKGKAIDILRSDPQLESTLAEEMREKEKIEIGVKVPVREFWDRMLTDGEEPIAAQVSNQPLEIGIQKSGTSKKVPSIYGAAIFQGDRLVGWLNDKETRGVLWIRNELKSGVLAVPVPKEEGGGRIGARIWKVSTKIKPIFRNDKLVIKIEAYGDVEIFENASRLDLSNPTVLNTLQSVFAKDVKARIQLTLNKTQQVLQSDIFGFGKAVYGKYPKSWNLYYKQRWNTIFPNIEVEIDPHITVQGTGFTTKPMLLPETKH